MKYGRSVLMGSSLAAGIFLGLWPTPSVAGCGASECTGTGAFSGACCIDGFAGCKKFEKRTCPSSQLIEYRFLRTYQGQCNEATARCEYPDGTSAEEPG